MTGSRPTVVFVGPPAAGKSRIARRVAALLDQPYLDTDTAIVVEHGPISDIFHTRGEAFFRGVERNTVHEALSTGGVVALGGGAVIDPDTRAELAEHRVAHITISAEAVEQRLNPEKRPLLKDLASWVALAEARKAWYEEVATITFDASHRKIDDLAAEVFEWLQKETSE
jgi:shikimate kinase